MGYVKKSFNKRIGKNDLVKFEKNNQRWNKLF